VIHAAERALTVQVSAGRGEARMAILRRAVVATCSKAQLPVDRIDDAVLILETLLADRYVARADEVHLVLTANPGSISLMIGPLADREAHRLLEQADLPLVGSIIKRLSTTATTVDEGSHLLIFVDAR